jgi:plasmid stabilization system protein ParE
MSFVRIAENFQRNLEEIERFLIEAAAPQAYDALLDELLETVIPNLQRFPEMGHPFFARQARSVEAVNAVERLRKALSALTADFSALREYLFADYLVLYVQIEGGLYLLAIRHHRQLSFDFNAHG